MAWLENGVVVVVVGLALAWLGRRMYRWWRGVKAFTQAEHASPCVTCASGGPSACQACAQVDTAHKPSYAIRPNLQIRVQGQGQGRSRMQGAKETPLPTDAPSNSMLQQQNTAQMAAEGVVKTLPSVELSKKNDSKNKQ